MGRQLVKNLGKKKVKGKKEEMGKEIAKEMSRGWQHYFKIM